MEYETVIGLEVHLQLKTNTKAFCGCSTDFGNEPNSQVCAVCLGLPGALPVLNAQAMEYAIKAGLALNCNIQEFTKFDRKHYFYPDLPKNFQISQYDLPVCLNGSLTIDIEEGKKTIRIRRVHLEEDAGKLIHAEKESLVDYNRTGIALLEIVSEPDINSPQEAYEYLAKLKSILEYLDISDCDMEKGSLRCDANISLRKKGDKELGVKTELKNMNSFKAVREALGYESLRQSEALNEGEKIIQETRLWDAKSQKTVSMRTKEEAKDYRYFPEPDLPPFIISREKIEKIKNTLPELPEEKKDRLIKEYGLSDYDAKVLVISKQDALYAEECLGLYAQKEKKPIVNWLIGPALSAANSRHKTVFQLEIPAKDMVELVGMVESSRLSNLGAKTVLEHMIDEHKGPAQIVTDKNLSQVSDTGELEKYIQEALKENAKSVDDYKSGKENAIMFLVGQVMKKSKGKANPKIVREMLKERIK